MACYHELRIIKIDERLILVYRWQDAKSQNP